MVKKRAQVGEMSVEEFMHCGLDSDTEQSTEQHQEEEEPTKKIKKKKVKKIQKKDSGGAVKKIISEEEEKKKKENEIGQHKDHLDGLKEKDPEFYEFLLENDEELLKFDDSEVEDDDEEDEAVENNAATADDATNDATNSDNDDDDDETSSRKKVIVTVETCTKWKVGLAERSVKTLKTAMHAYHSAVVSTSPEEEEEEEGEEEGKKGKKKSNKQESKFQVDGGAPFNNLITMCVQHAIPTLEKFLAYQRITTESDTAATTVRKGKSPLPSSSKRWPQVKPVVKQYLLDNLQLLRQLADPAMVSIMLRHALNLSAYFACFPKISKAALKRAIRMWYSGSEQVRVLAFLLLRRLVSLTPSLRTFSLRRMYTAFVSSARFMTPQSRPLVIFMQNSMVEMCAGDASVTYQLAFVFIRQLAIHLRNATMSKKKDAHQAVYNWQFISCAQLWARVVSELRQEALQPLIYPVVQILIGVIGLIPSSRWLPLRFHCVRSLNSIARHANVYIPTSSFLVRALESTEFQRKPTATQKPPEFSVVLKVTKVQLNTKGVQDVIIDQVFELLIDHFSIHSSSIGFPELIFPPCQQIKRLVKQSKVVKMNRDMKQLIEKLSERAREISTARALVTFAPRDEDQVRSWEEQQQTNTLTKFLDSWRALQERTKRDTETLGDQDQTSSQGSKSAKAGAKRKAGADKQKDVSAKTVVKKKKSKTPQPENDDDVVEDLVFSDDES